MPESHESIEQIAKSYEGISTDSLRRHIKFHMKELENSSNEIESNDLNPDDLIPEAEIQSWKCYQSAIASGDMTLGMKSLSAAIELTKLRRKDQDEGRQDTSADLSASDEWIDLRSKLLKALEPYSDALEAVRRVLAKEDEATV
ncbi:MAG: hypothetical protein WB392_06360 [Methanotrichaceae archaeon]